MPKSPLRLLLVYVAIFARVGAPVHGDSGQAIPLPAQENAASKGEGSGAEVVSAGPVDARMAPFDRMMAEFLRRHRVAGAALAVTDHGRLVHARGYGYADLDRKEQVLPTSLFRIASVSKPITAVAVLQLVEKGHVRMDDRVFDLLGWAETLGGGQSAGPFDERLESVTVRHLLQHRGGWDRDKSFDPMFRSARFAEELNQPPPAGTDAIIRCMFRQPLDFAPGERYAYSNYGYCLLGRIIEKATGKPYEEYVLDQVLRPLGIRSMRIGRTRLEDRQQNEVHYYDPAEGKSVFAADLGKPVPHPYGAWCLEAMDAHGGWLASVVDLARFAAALRAPGECKILRAESILAMYERPEGLAGYESDGAPKTVYYSCGWQNRAVGDKFNRWHTGSLPGTAALLVLRHDDRQWAVLLNSRVSPYSDRLTRDIDPLLHKAADAVEAWPEYDLFETAAITSP